MFTSLGKDQGLEVRSKPILQPFFSRYAADSAPPPNNPAPKQASSRRPMTRTRDVPNVTCVASSVLPLMHPQRRPPTSLSLWARHSSHYRRSSVPIGDGQSLLQPRVGLRVGRNASAPTLSILGTVPSAGFSKASSRVRDTIILVPSSGPMVVSAGGGDGGKGPQTDPQCIWMRAGLFSYVFHCLSE